MTTTIHEQTKILVELQKIDAEVYHLKKELASHPLQKKELEAAFERKKASAKAAEDAVKAAQIQQKQKEGDLAQREERILKLQGQLYQLKSNKEYSAMEFEIKGLKADKSLLEDDILKLLDAVDGAKAALAREKEALSSEEKKYQAELAELNKNAAQLQGAISIGEEKRKTYTPNLEPRLLLQYERILKSREGMALVPIVNNACGGCHMGFPPQIVNEAQQREKWIICESCARLVYWPS